MVAKNATPVEAKVRAPKRRRLTELYVTGKELTLTDDEGYEETLWLSKLSPVEQKEAADNATAARARLLSLKKNPESDERQMAVFTEQMSDMGLTIRDNMISYLSAPKLQEAIVSAEARISSEGEWAENDYLTSLQAAWNEELFDRYAKDTDTSDAEAQRVHDELQRFTVEVEEAVKEERANIVLEWEHEADEALYKKVLDRIIDTESDFAWVNEFSKWQVYFAVRTPEDHKERYFESREEVDSVQSRVLNEILNAYSAMTVDPTEGKG